MSIYTNNTNNIYTKYTIVTSKYYKSNDNHNLYYNFSKLIKNTSGFIYVYDYDYESIYNIKKKISDSTGIPIETIYEIGDLGGGNACEYYIYNNLNSLYTTLKNFSDIFNDLGFIY